MTQLRVEGFGQHVGSRIKLKYFCLAAILALHIGYIVYYEVEFWSNFPDGDVQKIPDGTGYWILLLILLYVWCKADSRDRQVELPLLPSVLVPLLFPIGIPYYFLRTYPRRRALFHIGLAVTFAVACWAVTLMAGRVAFYYLIVAH